MSNWEPHLVTPEHLGCTWADGLGAVMNALVGTAQRSWPMLREGIRALRDAPRRTITVGDETPLAVDLLHNPARLTSVVANPSRDARCPLCAQNLPKEEKGIAVGRTLVALPNPAPIIGDHVVFAHREHVPQALQPCMADLTWLVSMIGENVVLLYNGPTSGASSPYHLHLQAGHAEDLPLTGVASLPSVAIRATSWGSIAAVQAGGRRFLLLTMDNAADLMPACSQAMALFQSDGEFPHNLIIWRRGQIHAAVFPRGRHRPSCYFLPEDRRTVISPGSVEMAGLVVLPRRLDWERMEGCALRRVYQEVCLDDGAWQELRARISR